MFTRDWNDYLNIEIDCACGEKHSCNIEKIIIEENAISKLPELIMSGFYHNICVVCDQTTKEIAGNTVFQELRSNLIHFVSIVLNDKEPKADEKSLGEILVHIPPKCDLILAVGSGTVNDLCKFVSYKLGIDYMIVGTAPSMDGYASNVSPLLVNQMKETFEAELPKAIIADTRILCEAPYEMIIAGVGDILGKYVCLTDWKLSNLVTGEYYCNVVEELVRDSIELVVEALPRIKEREVEGISTLMEALVLSGIAMSFVGNSRPASGSEHHLSHFWEMMFLQENRKCALHGTKVGVGTVVALGLYEEIKKDLIRLEELPEPEFQEEEWKENIRHIYKQSANQIIELEESVHKNSNHMVQARRDALKEHREEIEILIGKLPKREEMITLLQSVGAPYLPDQIQVSDNMVSDSIRYAKELRNRYGILQMRFDLGC